MSEEEEVVSPDEGVLIEGEGNLQGPKPKGKPWSQVEGNLRGPVPTEKYRMPTLHKKVLLGIVVGFLVLMAALGKASAETPLEAAISGCSDDLRFEDRFTWFKYSDSGKTLTIDGRSRPGRPDGAPIETIACALQDLDMPTTVQWQIENTSAASGIQTAEWKPSGWLFHKVTASWTYHPEEGLDMVITSR